MSGGLQLEFINKLKALAGNTLIGYVSDELLPSILTRVSQHLDQPARFYASATPDEYINFTGFMTTNGDGTGKILPPDANNLVGTAINPGKISFKTGAVIGGTSVTVNNLPFAIPPTTVGYFRRMVIAQTATGLKARFSDEVVGPYNYATLDDPGTLWAFLVEATPVMFVDLEAYDNGGFTAFKTANSATSIIENSVVGVPRIFNLGGGGDGNSGLQNQIDALQSDLDAILANNPKQEKFVATNNQTVFNTVTMNWSASNTSYDIEVFVDGRRQTQDANGLLVESYRKNSATQIELSEGALLGKEVLIWKQGTAAISGGGGAGQGLSQLDPANALYLLDQGDLSTVWKLSVVNGSLGIVAV